MSNGADGSIENLKQRLGMIIEACNGIQSAARLIEDRTDGAIVSLTHTCEDSANDDVSNALAALGEIKSVVEQQIAAAVRAADAIASYSASR
jgi:hypothetical protein